MKNSLIIVGIIGISVLMTLGLAFLIFNLSDSPNNITGLATDDIEEATEEDSLKAIEEAKEIISRMKEDGFSTNFVEDKLKEAKRQLGLAKSKEILETGLSPLITVIDLREAREALEYADVDNVGYERAIEIVEEIKQAKEQSILLSDRIAATQISLSPGEGEIQDEETIALLNKIEIAFEEERYDEVESLLVELRDLTERKKQETTFLKTVQTNARNFIQRNWYYILAFLIVISIIGFIFNRRISLHLLKRKVRKMKTEKRVLIALMKKAQTERFKENKISALVYNIRMKKYQERLNEIKETLPVLEKRLG